MIIIASYSNVSVTYTADGTQTVFSFPFDYLRKAFVYVEVNEETILTQGTDYTVSGKTVVFPTAPASGTLLRIYRETDTTRLVSWADASVLKASDMTVQQVQELHILEEQEYWTKENTIVRNGHEWNARHFPIKNTGDPVDPKDATTKEYVDDELDIAIENLQLLADIVVDSEELQHITDQFNAIDENAEIAANAAETAVDSATSANASKISASASDTSATNTANALINFLETKETLTAPAVDATLTISGAAADAKVTGDKVSFLKDINLKALSGESHFTNMVRGGLDNTTAELTTQTFAVSSPDWFSFDYPVELHVAEGYQFRVAYKNRETEVVYISSYNNHNSPGYVILNDTSDCKIMILTNPITYSVADPDTFAKQVTFSLPSWYVEQVNKMNVEKLKEGNCLLDGLMVRGTYNPNYISYVYYRVVPRRILQFDRNITITANDGFKFGMQYFNEEGTRTADYGWKTVWTVPANQRFIVIIARTTENTSEIADIFHFWNQLNVSTPLKKLVEDDSASVNFLRDFFKCGGKPKLCSHAGYKVGSIENSIPAFEAAGENGYWCLESDVQQTSDGYFIMMHDTTVDRTTDGTGSISSMTLAQIRALHLKGFPDLQVPTLQEYLAICKRYNMVPQLEMKSTVSNYAGLIAEIKKAGMYWSIMLSGSQYNVSSIRAITEDIPFIGIAQAGFYPSGYDAFITTMKAYKNTGVALEYTGTITDANIQTCHDADMPICIFTCDTEAKVKEMFELGADCITTNVVLP